MVATSVGIGFSQEGNIALAARDSALQAKAQLKENPVDFAIVFATGRYSSPEALRIVRQTLNVPKMTGCSTAYVFFSDGVMTSGIATVAVYSENIKTTV